MMQCRDGAGVMSQSLHQAKDGKGQPDVNQRERGRNKDNVNSEGDSADTLKVLEPVKIAQADRQDETGDIAPEKVIGMALE